MSKQTSNIVRYYLIACTGSSTEPVRVYIAPTIAAAFAKVPTGGMDHAYAIWMIQQEASSPPATFDAERLVVNTTGWAVELDRMIPEQECDQ